MRTTTAAFVFASLTALAAACSSEQKTATTAATAAKAPQPVPAGTEFMVRLNDNLGTKASTPGEFFTATVLNAIRSPDGGIIAPEGARVHGRVVSVDSGGLGTVRIAFTGIDTAYGQVPIQATVKKPEGSANYRVEEVYGANQPYSAILLPAQPSAVGGGPGQQPAGQVNLPAGTNLRLVLTQPLAAVPATQQQNKK
jgi:hypothetical protein